MKKIVHYIIFLTAVATYQTGFSLGFELGYFLTPKWVYTAHDIYPKIKQRIFTSQQKNKRLRPSDKIKKKLNTQIMYDKSKIHYVKQKFYASKKDSMFAYYEKGKVISIGPKEGSTATHVIKQNKFPIFSFSEILGSYIASQCKINSCKAQLISLKNVTIMEDDINKWQEKHYDYPYVYTIHNFISGKNLFEKRHGNDAQRIHLRAINENTLAFISAWNYKFLSPIIALDIFTLNNDRQGDNIIIDEQNNAHSIDMDRSLQGCMYNNNGIRAIRHIIDCFNNLIKAPNLEQTEITQIKNINKTLKRLIKKFPPSRTMKIAHVVAQQVGYNFHLFRRLFFYYTISQNYKDCQELTNIFDQIIKNHKSTKK